MTEHISERQLISKCIAGDRMHQKRLFDMYAGKMMTLCLRYGRDHLEAEDMLQEGFVKVFRSLNTYTFKGSFEGWIRKIIINTALNKVSKKYISNEINNLDNIEPISADYTEILSMLSEKEILKIISDLPEGYKIVFNLYAVEGYSHKEIADLLGINEGTSRSQLAKARKLLQNKIEAFKKVSL